MVLFDKTRIFRSWNKKAKSIRPCVDFQLFDRFFFPVAFSFYDCQFCRRSLNGRVFDLSVGFFFVRFFLSLSLCVLGCFVFCLWIKNRVTLFSFLCRLFNWFLSNRFLIARLTKIRRKKRSECYSEREKWNCVWMRARLLNRRIKKKKKKSNNNNNTISIFD